MHLEAFVGVIRKKGGEITYCLLIQIQFHSKQVSPIHLNYKDLFVTDGMLNQYDPVVESTGV